MRPVVSALVGLVLVAVAAQGTARAQPPAANRSAVEKDLIARERAAIEAFAKVDPKRYYQAVGWEGILADPLGTLKATEQSNLMAQTRVESYTVDNFQVHWLSDGSAVVTYHWTGKATRLGQPLPNQIYASTVWVKRGDSWVASVHQEALMAAPTK
jgi:hypothetical protein